jgi:hypothetical protein
MLVGVFIQPGNHRRVTADAEIGYWGREAFLSHTVPPTFGYIIFNKYVILKEGVSKNKKKKKKNTTVYSLFLN